MWKGLCRIGPTSWTARSVVGLECLLQSATGVSYWSRASLRHGRHGGWMCTHCWGHRQVPGPFCGIFDHRHFVEDGSTMASLFPFNITVYICSCFRANIRLGSIIWLTFWRRQNCSESHITTRTESRGKRLKLLAFQIIVIKIYTGGISSAVNYIEGIVLLFLLINSSL